MRIYKNSNKKLLRIGFFVFAFVLLFCRQANAVNLRIFSPVDEFNINDFFKIYVIIDDNASPINAFSGKISLPTDALQFKSIETSDSVSNFWIKEPKYDENTNTISFEGVILEKEGFRETRGELFAINLKALKTGPSHIDFLSGAIFAHNGQGTNILNSLEPLKFSISDRKGCSDSPEGCVSQIDETSQEARLQGTNFADEYSNMGQKVGYNLSFYEILLIVLLLILIIIILTFFAYIIALKQHKNTEPKTLTDSWATLIHKIENKKISDLFAPHRHFFLPLFISPLVSIAVIYTFFGSIDSFGCFILKPTINMPSFNFIVLCAINLFIYFIIINIIYIFISRKTFVGGRFFIGSVVGAIIILAVISTDYQAYKDIILQACI